MNRSMGADLPHVQYLTTRLVDTCNSLFLIISRTDADEFTYNRLWGLTVEYFCKKPTIWSRYFPDYVWRVVNIVASPPTVQTRQQLTLKHFTYFALQCWADQLWKFGQNMLITLKRIDMSCFMPKTVLVP